jgi:hypothetical protein
MTRPILDWKSYHDPRSLNYGIREKIGTVEKRVKLWRGGPVLDQGQEGACVGFGWTGELLASPKRDAKRISSRRSSQYAKDIYHRAQQIDEFPGENYEGTSVLAGAKTVVERRFMTSYRWAFGINDVRDALITEGPVVIGIPWLYDMYETDQNYEVHVGGDVVGGHCILLTGYNPKHKDYNGREMYRWRNSWGTSYGKGGDAWIEAGALAELLKEQGEACVPQGRQTVRI